jgi:hypothetical protein
MSAPAEKSPLAIWPLTARHQTFQRPGGYRRKMTPSGLKYLNVPGPLREVRPVAVISRTVRDFGRTDGVAPSGHKRLLGYV